MGATMLLRTSIAAGGILLLVGCAIRPLPQDFSGVPTTVIVKQIRCETQKAIKDLAIGWLTSDDNFANGRVDAVSRQIGFDFDEGRRPIQHFSPRLFHGRVREVVALFYETGVASNFDLEMTEQNNLGAEINLLKPFIDSNRTLGIKAKADRSRKNGRMFTITDTFESLIRLPDTYCNGATIGLAYNHVVGPNYIYPITGQIGINGFIRDFINLTLFENLGAPDTKSGTPPTIVDALEFNTVVSGSLAPKVTFSPVGTNLQVANASLLAEATRIDLHKITMGLALAKKGAPRLARVQASLFTPLISASPSTAAESRAAEAVNQALTLKIFRPSFVVVP
jgi:hypothetical protein